MTNYPIRMTYKRGCLLIRMSCSHVFYTAHAICHSNTETEMSSAWQPWYSLETLELVFNVSREYQGCHPDDLSVSVMDYYDDTNNKYRYQPNQLSISWEYFGTEKSRTYPAHPLFRSKASVMTQSPPTAREATRTRTPAFWDTPAAPWLPILLSQIGSQVKTRQSQSYKF